MKDKLPPSLSYWFFGFDIVKFKIMINLFSDLVPISFISWMNKTSFMFLKLQYFKTTTLQYYKR